MPSVVRIVNNINSFQNILRGRQNKVAEKVGQFCLRKMKLYVPVDTGFLKSRCQYKVSGFIFKKVSLKNDAYYASYVEYGTFKMEAQPFIRPSVERHISEIKNIVRGVYDGI